MKPLVNIHTHFMHTDHLSENYVVQMLRESIPRLINKIAPGSKEELLTLSKNKMYWKGFICKLGGFLNIAPKNTEKWARALNSKHFWYSAGTIDNYVKKGQYVHKNDLLADATLDYEIIVPLMMDMETAGSLSAENHSYIDPQINNNNVTGCTPYELQVCEYSMITARYPWQVFPFVMFNPINPTSLSICKEAVESLGFIGIKMYPPHGFNPNPDVNKDEKIKQRLLEFYEWANALSLPVTVHTQYQSMQAINMDDDFVLEQNFAGAANWESILENYKNIRVNFAHFGGTEYVKKCNETGLLCVLNKQCSELYKDEDSGKSFCRKLETSQEKFSLAGIDKICELSDKFNEPGNVRVFADISAHYDKNKKRQTKYIEHIKSFIDNNRNLKLMYGTDTPVINMEINDKIFFDSYNSQIDIDKYPEFYSTNATDFLFKNGMIPENYVKFLKKPVFKFEFKTYKSLIKNPPRWIQSDGKNYAIKGSKAANEMLSANPQ